jgi:hypothetical protein
MRGGNCRYSGDFVRASVGFLSLLESDSDDAKWLRLSQYTGPDVAFFPAKDNPVLRHRGCDVKDVSRMISAAAVVAVVAIVAGCADSPTAPFDLSSKPDFEVTVKTVAVFRDKMGKSHRIESAPQRLRARFNEKGLAEAVAEEVPAAKTPLARFANVGEGAARFVDLSMGGDSANPTALLGSTNGSLRYNYADTTYDSDGNMFEYYAWAASGDSPPTNFWAYKNGVMIGTYQAQWDSVSGGYILGSQVLTSYENGSAVGTVSSTVSSDGSSTHGTIYQTKGQVIRKRAWQYAKLGVDKVVCWLGPKVAYAMDDPCWGEAADWAGETFVLGAATYEGYAFLNPYAYFAGWGLWTRSTIKLGQCLDNLGKGKRRGGSVCGTNPRVHGCVQTQ